jgi:hypothetical protein
MSFTANIGGESSIGGTDEAILHCFVLRRTEFHQWNCEPPNLFPLLACLNLSQKKDRPNRYRIKSGEDCTTISSTGEKCLKLRAIE